MNIGGIIVLCVAIVLFAVMIVLRTRQNKKQQEEFYKFIDTVKVGDRVKTHIGVYGKIISITETTEGKVFVIETGDKNKSEIEVDYRVLAGLDTKETVIYDTEGKPVTTGQLVVAKTLAEDEVNKQIEKVSKERATKKAQAKQEEIANEPKEPAREEQKELKQEKQNQPKPAKSKTATKKPAKK